MSPKTSTTTKWALASYALRDAFTDFILSRQAIQCTARTMGFYEFALSKFIAWLESQGVSKPDEVTARLVRSYIAELTARGLADTTLHGNARAIRTLVRFWHSEGYLLDAVKFAMPKLTKKRLPVLTAEQVSIILHACHNPRDKAVILLMVDTGIRLNEAINLDWSDVDIMTGLARVQRGKGGKARSVVAGATTRRALLAYRRTLLITTENAPLIQTREGSRFTSHGLHQVFKRLAISSGVPFSAHALRRTFVILSLRAGMDVLHLQALLGHASLDMVQHYAQMIDEDLLTSHQAHSPIDNLARLR
jgi:integrase/recombinase XerD